MDKMNGEKIVASKNNTPVVTAVKPVRPPTPTPEVDSTKLVTVEVPKAAPATVPIASDNKALSPFSSSPFLFTSQILFPIEIKVPAVSKKSTNKKEKRITIAWNGEANNSAKPFANCPAAEKSKLKDAT